MPDERRRAPRYSAHLPASITRSGETGPINVMVEDLCTHGCLLECAPAMQVNQPCEFFMNWRGRKFRTSAVVAWRSETGQVGLEFLNTDPVNQVVLRGICSDLLSRTLVRLPHGEE